MSKHDQSMIKAKNAQDGGMTNVANFEKRMSPPGGFQKSNVSSGRIPNRPMTSGDGPEESGVYSPPISKTSMTTEEYFTPGIFELARNEMRALSYWGLRLLVWLFALDKPVDESFRALLAMRIVIQYIVLLLFYRRLKATIQNVFRGAWL